VLKVDVHGPQGAETVEDRDDYEVFDVGMLVYLQGREEPITIMAGIRAPTSRDYSATRVVEATEDLIDEQQRDSTVAWLRFESTDGDVTFLYKHEIQLIRIIKPEVTPNE